MEPRLITIISTKESKTSTLMSAATTLRQLKADLTAADINYSGMIFLEGTSHTELKDDAAILPKDIPYKGTITNELVFMLTADNKNIKSGAFSQERTDAYKGIVDLGLKEKCIAKYGKNYTMCSTSQLKDLISKSLVKVKEAITTRDNMKSSDSEIKALASRIDALSLRIEALENNLTKKEEKQKSPYSQRELDEMFGI